MPAFLHGIFVSFTKSVNYCNFLFVFLAQCSIYNLATIESIKECIEITLIVREKKGTSMSVFKCNFANIFAPTKQISLSVWLLGAKDDVVPHIN